MHRTASTTSSVTLLAGAALFAALTACAVAPASAVADPAAAVKWEPVSDGWNSKDIATLEAAFSAGRNGDASVPADKKAFKVGMDQTKWDAMDEQERALHVLNLERTDRGLDPISAVVAPVKAIAQDYAEFLQAKATPDGAEGLKSTADQAAWTSAGKPTSTCCTYEERLSAQSSVINARDSGFKYGEALAWTSVTSADKLTDAFTWAIYNWIYDDATASWGHRKFMFAVYDEISGNGHGGKAKAEGIVGFGKKFGARGAYIVMNAVDQNKGWNHCVDLFRFDGAIPACAGAPVPEGSNNTANPPSTPVPGGGGGGTTPDGTPAGTPLPDTNDGSNTPNSPRSATYDYPCDEGEKDGEMDNIQVFVMTLAFMLPLGFIIGAWFAITWCQVAKLDLDGVLSPEILGMTGYDQKPKKNKGKNKGKAAKKGKDVEAGKKKGKKKAASSSDSDSDSDSSSDSD